MNAQAYLQAAARPRSAPPAPSEPLITLQLTAQDIAVLATAALVHAIDLFAAAERAEAAGLMSKADEMTRDGCRLSRVEMKLRRTANGDQ